jgi:hypothetical protein
VAGCADGVTYTATQKVRAARPTPLAPTDLYRSLVCPGVRLEVPAPPASAGTCFLPAVAHESDVSAPRGWPGSRRIRRLYHASRAGGPFSDIAGTLLLFPALLAERQPSGRRRFRDLTRAPPAAMWSAGLCTVAERTVPTAMWITKG